MLFLFTSLSLLNPTWASSVHDALAVGDCELALSSATEGLSPATNLALAQCSLKQSDPASALTRLSSVDQELWSGHAAALRGQAQLMQDQPIDAVQSLQDTLADKRVVDPVRQKAKLDLAKALRAIEDPSGSAQILKAVLADGLDRPGKLPVPGGADPAEIRWWLAQLATEQSQPDQAITYWQEIWVRNPTSPWAEKAAEKLAEVGKTVPDTNTSSGQALVTGRIKTLQKLFHHKEALELRRLLPAGHGFNEPHRLASAIFKAKEYEEAAQVFASLSTRSDDEGVLLALSQVRSGDPAASIQTYRNVAKGTTAKADLAAFKIGYMYWDQGDFETSTTEFDAYLNNRPNGKHADSALWFKAMAELRLERKSNALRTLRRLETSHPRSSLVAGCKYWEAKLSDEPARKKELLHEVVRKWPTSGYAWFASHELGIQYPAKKPLPPLRDAPELASIDWTIGLALSEAGLHSWARPHLESLTAKARTMDKASRLTLARALIDSGSYRAAQRLAKPWCGKPGTSTDPEVFHACWPQPSRTRVMKLADEAGLPQYLPFAIMTAESALRPEVTSPAGARGLMQIMPSLAEKLHAERWPNRSHHPDDLFSPAYNATLGTSELAHLAKLFSETGIDPSLPLVISGYNGGSEAVSRWVSLWDVPPHGDLWSEYVGYTETRKYVKRVLGFLQTYRLVYGDPSSDHDSQEQSSSTDGTNANGTPALP